MALECGENNPYGHICSSSWIWTQDNSAKINSANLLGQFDIYSYRGRWLRVLTLECIGGFIKLWTVPLITCHSGHLCICSSIIVYYILDNIEWLATGQRTRSLMCSIGPLEKTWTSCKGQLHCISGSFPVQTRHLGQPSAQSFIPVFCYFIYHIIND